MAWIHVRTMEANMTDQCGSLGREVVNVYISLPLFDYFNLFGFAYLLDN